MIEMKITQNETYIETVVYKDKMINVFLDDAGQSYYIQYYDELKKEIVEVGCGCYNGDYLDFIECYFE